MEPAAAIKPPMSALECPCLSVALCDDVVDEAVTVTVALWDADCPTVAVVGSTDVECSVVLLVSDRDNAMDEVEVLVLVLVSVLVLVAVVVCSDADDECRLVLLLVDAAVV